MAMARTTKLLIPTTPNFFMYSISPFEVILYKVIVMPKTGINTTLNIVGEAASGPAPSQPSTSTPTQPSTTPPETKPLGAQHRELAASRQSVLQLGTRAWRQMNTFKRQKNVESGEKGGSSRWTTILNGDQPRI